MAQAKVKYRNETGAAAEHVAEFSTPSEAETYARGVVKDGFGTPGSGLGTQKFYPAEAVTVVEVA